MWTERRPARQRGFTLPEALLAIVVLGLGLAGVIAVFQQSARRSADPIAQQQMAAIAQELLEEIRLKPYAPLANSAPSGCARDTYNDVSDYHGYSSSGVCTVDGSTVSTLSRYNVAITVASATLGGVAAAKKISITIGHDNLSITLVGWRTDYAS